jgi:cysteinyl-tRNA synthetase
MSMDYFGAQFDIHGGGHDLRFPHHEAEIFQGECHTGCSPVVHHWLHNGFVNIDGEKMSKSLGNFWTIRDILEKIDAMVLRFSLINAHYRSPIDMNETLLKDAERNYNRLLETYVQVLKVASSSPNPVDLPHADITSQQPFSRSLGLLEKMGEGFAQAMDDDFNSRDAIGKVLGAVRQIAKTMDSGLDDADRHAFAHYAVDWLEETAGSVLGVLPSREMALAEPVEDPRRAEVAEQVEQLLVARSEARSSKDWGKADEIRDQLNSMGVVVVDTPDGPSWKLE